MTSSTLTRDSVKVSPHAPDGRAGADLIDISNVLVDSRLYRTAKRALDLTLTGVGLLLASPLMALIALAVKLESPGPVLFGHERLGRGGKRFRCLKFRTMRAGAQGELLLNPELKRRYVENDYKLPLENDPRITRLGRFLRKTSLDELPQAFNVLTGTMSLVGPRPIVPEELRWYNGDADSFLSVKPGITGPWQIQGRSRIGYPNRTSVELRGIRERSLLGDIKILVRSIPVVLTTRGSV